MTDDREMSQVETGNIIKVLRRKVCAFASHADNAAKEGTETKSRDAACCNLASRVSEGIQESIFYFFTPAGAGVLFVVVLVLWGYAPSLRGGFIWDDRDIYILNNELLRFPGGLYRIWFSSEPVDYYPLSYTTFWLEWQLVGAQPFLYRIDNLLLHLGTSVFSWLVLRKLGVPGAGVVAAIFAVHPVCVETVAWIAQRKACLATCLGFAGIYCHLSANGSGKPLPWWRVAGYLLFALSLASKPVFITLTVIIFSYHWVWQSDGVKTAVWQALPYGLLSCLFGIVGVLYQNKLIGTDVVRDQSFWERLATSGRAVWFYVGKILWPTELSFVYPRWNIDVSAFIIWLPLAGVVAVLGFSTAFHHRRVARAVLAGFGFFLITLFPALGFIDVYFWRYSFVGDHYQYQSMLGILAFVVYALHHLLESFSNGKSSTKRLQPALNLLLLLILVPLLAWSTHDRARLFANERAVWRDALQKNPNSELALQNLVGSIVRMPEAERVAREALESMKLRPTALFCLGEIRRISGETKEARAFYSDALRLGFEPHTIHAALAQVALDEKEWDTAIKHAKRVVELKPHRGEAWLALGRMNSDRGDPEAAENAFRKVTTQCWRKHADAWLEIAQLHLRGGGAENALQAASMAVSMRPQSLQARIAYEQSLRMAGRVKEADAQKKRMLRQ